MVAHDLGEVTVPTEDLALKGLEVTAHEAERGAVDAERGADRALVTERVADAAALVSDVWRGSVGRVFAADEDEEPHLPKVLLAVQDVADADEVPATRARIRAGQ